MIRIYGAWNHTKLPEIKVKLDVYIFDDPVTTICFSSTKV